MVEFADLVMVEIDGVGVFGRNFIVGEIDGWDNLTFDAVEYEDAELMDSLADGVNTEALYLGLFSGEDIVIGEEVDEVFVELEV